MPYYLVENKLIQTVIKARDPRTAHRHFARRYPVYAELGASLVKAPGPWIPGVEPRRG